MNLYETGDEYFLTYLFIWVIFFGIICGAISQSKGNGFGTGFLIGGLLGIIGLIIVAVQKDGSQRGAVGQISMMRECPSCKEWMRRDASVCPHCRRDSVAWTWHEGTWWFKNPAGEWFYLENNQWVRSKGNDSQ